MKSNRIEVIVGGDEPQPTTPLPLSLCLSLTQKPRTDPLAWPKGIEGNDLTAIFLSRKGKKPYYRIILER